jgi:hypothetical protein
MKSQIGTLWIIASGVLGDDVVGASIYFGLGECVAQAYASVLILQKTNAVVKTTKTSNIEYYRSSSSCSHGQIIGEGHDIFA